MSNYVVYSIPSDADPPASSALPPGYSYATWTPRLRAPAPPGLGWKGAAWSLFHWLRIFANREYRVVCVRHGTRLVHRSVIVPRYFRWPFMAPRDVQVSSTWTDPEYRGRGLATAALVRAVELAPRGARIWYVSRDENAASIAVCRKAGFTRTGEAVRTRRLGLRALGRLELTGASP